MVFATYCCSFGTGIYIFLLRRNFNGFNGRPFWVGALSVEQPITESLVKSALTQLGKNLGSIQNKNDVKTMKRGYFHASFDSDNAHSVLCEEIINSKIDANFMSYCSGTIYYSIQLKSGLYQFPIPVVEDQYEYVPVTYSDLEATITKYQKERAGIKLSSDLGTATFEAVMKGSLLCRWINKAIENQEFIKIG